MKLVIGILTTIMTLVYPFIIYYGSQFLEPRWLMLGFALVFALRSFAFNKGLSKLISLPFYLFIVLLCLGSFFLGRLQLMYYIPSLISLSLFALFFHSLFTEQSFIEKFARMENPNLPPPAVTYCRYVTMVWCLFFILNASVAGHLAYQDNLEQWTNYTGLYSYLLIATLFAIEFGIRSILKPRFDRFKVEESTS